jgi:hypothetical protein
MAVPPSFAEHRTRWSSILTGRRHRPHLVYTPTGATSELFDLKRSEVVKKSVGAFNMRMEKAREALEKVMQVAAPPPEAEGEQQAALEQ